MKWISHRGNINGPDPSSENRVEYIAAALYEGLDVEVDVWAHNDIIYLGHDEPIEPLPSVLLYNTRIWFHCKNNQALEYFVNHRTALCKHGVDFSETPKYFWHQTDDYTLTSHNHIWVYPGKKLIPGSVAVIPEISYDGDLSKCYAICTDYITRFKQEVIDA